MSRAVKKTKDPAPTGKKEFPLTESDVYFRETIVHGVPPNVRCMGYDPIQGFLAIGTTNGEVVIYGRPAVDRRYQLGPSSAVRYIFFMINEGYVVAITSQRQVWILSLQYEMKQEQFSCGSGSITSFYHPTGTIYAYLGDENGTVSVVDLKEKKLSSFALRAIDVLGKNPSDGVSVTAIQGHPEEDGKLLIGYSNGQIALWDVKAKSASKIFGAGVPGLTCLSWHRSGKQFVAGYENGEVIIWNIKGDIFSRCLQTGGPRSIKRHPIRKIIWNCYSGVDRGVIHVLGGSLYSSDPENSVMYLSGPTYQDCDFAHFGTCRDILTTSSNPWANGPDDPNVLVVLPVEGGLQFYKIQQHGYPPLSVPSIFLLQNAQITSVEYVHDCPPEFLDDLLLLVQELEKDRIASIVENWPMKQGGRFSESFSSETALLITGHADGSIRFWNVSSVYITMIYTLDTKKQLVKKPQTPDIAMTRLCPSSRILAVAYGRGEVAVFSFRLVVPSKSPQAQSVSGASAPQSDHPNQPDESDNYVSKMVANSGFHYDNTIIVNKGSVTDMLLHTAIGRLIIGDDTGQLSIVSLEHHACIYRTQVLDDHSSIACLYISTIAPCISAPTARTLLFVGIGNGKIAAYDVEAMTPVLSIRPQNPNALIDCYIIDENGAQEKLSPPLWFPISEEEHAAKVLEIESLRPTYDSDDSVDGDFALKPEASRHESPEREDGPPEADGVDHTDEHHSLPPPIEIKDEPSRSTSKESGDKSPTEKPRRRSIIKSFFGMGSKSKSKSSAPSTSQTSSGSVPQPGSSSSVSHSSSQSSYSQPPSSEPSKRTEKKASKAPPQTTIATFDEWTVEAEYPPKSLISISAKHSTKYLIQVLSTSIQTISFPAMVRLHSVVLEEEVVQSYVLEWGGVSFLLAATCMQRLLFYTIPDLRLWAAIEPLSDDIIFRPHHKAHASLAPDGRIFTGFDGTQIHRYSVMDSENWFVATKGHIIVCFEDSYQ
eukprot:TRINITY_DN4647_c0_g1_i3.p1 TRINITY_DN4647_c0_g1~~TRINITY_DN4647_c0_g1_i3.p1  ORF type:complete len:992 (+),score=146.86 TRINITY_DN4647_c0_g1_i3:51-3026(+)